MDLESRPFVEALAGVERTAGQLLHCHTRPLRLLLGSAQAACAEFDSAVELLEGALTFVEAVGARPQAMATRAELRDRAPAPARSR